MICTSHLLMAPSHLQSVLVGLQPTLESFSEGYGTAAMACGYKGGPLRLGGPLLRQGPTWSTISFLDSLGVIEAAIVCSHLALCQATLWVGRFQLKGHTK